MKSGAAAFLATFFFAVAAYAYPAEVEPVPPKRYFDITLNEIQQAQSSIRLYMYFVSLPPSRFGSKVYRLLDALAEAKERGVDVQVGLDRNVDWTERDSSNFWDPEWKNWKAYRYLRGRGVTAFFDSEAAFTHAKLLVIDHETVILGSTNWSEAAMTRNVEANALIRSPEFAREILKDFEALELHAPALRDVPTVPVPWAFLNNPALLGRMVTAHDEAAFDAYLCLLKSSGEGEITVDYGTMEAELSIGGKNKWLTRRSIRKVLQRLQERYGLIDFSYKWGKEPVVSLREIENPGTVPPGDSPRRYVQVPLTYWDWGWNKRLTFAGKVMYLLEQMYSALSPMEPVWFRSTEDLGELHGFSRYFAQDGLMDLRRNNLVEAQPDALDPADYSDRKTNRYVSNSLYNPQELAQALRGLEQRYGKEKVERAIEYASLVYEDSDIGAVERLIILEGEFGEEAVRQAAQRVGGMSGNNPKKTAGYLIGTIQGIGSKADEGGVTSSP